MTDFQPQPGTVPEVNSPVPEATIPQKNTNTDNSKPQKNPNLKQKDNMTMFMFLGVIILFIIGIAVTGFILFSENNEENDEITDEIINEIVRQEIPDSQEEVVVVAPPLPENEDTTNETVSNDIQVEDTLYYIQLDQPGNSTGVDFTVTFPTAVAESTNNTTYFFNHIIYTGSDNSFTAVIVTPYETFPETFNEYEFIGDLGSFENVYQVETNSGTYYMNDITNPTQDCSALEQTYAAPCGNNILRDAQDTTVRFACESNDTTICEAIIASLSLRGFTE